MATKKVKLVKVLNTDKVKKGDIVLLTPSNLEAGKKDIYATTMNNHSIGRVSVKDGGSSYVSRDTLRGQLSIGDFLTAEVKSKTTDSITLQILTKDSIGAVNIDTYAQKGIPTDQLTMIKDKVVNGGLGSSCSKKAPVKKKVVVKKQATPKKKVVVKKQVAKEAVKAQSATVIAQSTNTKGAGTMRNTTMMDNIFGGTYGAVRTDEFKLGANGKLAVRISNGDYLALDTRDEIPSLVNTSDFTFEFGKVFVVPVEASKVVKNDLVIKDDALYFVVSNKEGRIKGISPEDKRLVELVSTKHVAMKQEYVRVVKTMFDFLPQDEKTTNTTDLMANPLMLMVAMKGEGEDGNAKAKDLLMMNMMNQAEGDIASNPMMMMMMMKDGGSKDMLLPMLMNQGGDIASNPMLLMALMGNDGDSKDILPLLMMGGLGKDGEKATGMEAMLPMLMMGDGDIDPMMLMMMTQGQGGAGVNSMLPLLLMGDKGGKGNGMKDMLPMLMMTGGLGGEQGDMNAMLPLMLMGDGDNNDMMLPLMMMQGQKGGQGADLMSNPMMLMALMGDKKDGGFDPMMLMAMTGGFGANAPKQAEVVVATPSKVETDKIAELAKKVEELTAKNAELLAGKAEDTEGQN